MTITDVAGNEFANETEVVDVKGNKFASDIPKVVDIVPCGSRVLLELLKPDEIIGTKLHIGENVKVAPQGIVLKVGNAVDPADWGFKIGDRVIINGTGTKVDDGSCVSHNGREVTLLEPTYIKAVLVEG